MRIKDNEPSKVKEQIENFIPFIEEQRDIQHKLAKKFQAQEWRTKLHENNAIKFTSLLAEMKSWARQIDEMESELSNISQATRERITPDTIQLSLRFDEVEDLPEEVIAELSLSDSDKTDYQIRSLIEELGGIASLDRIIVGLYRTTGEIHKRSSVTSRIYRMTQKGILFGVPGRKGVYSLEELTEDEADRIISGKPLEKSLEN